ncbi:MAG TPA: CPBP family intramembrane glutamic endopeptidase [Fimbriimonadaceae bacterium]|jgi:membrane protease YdiL (CAAX protease family)
MNTPEPDICATIPRKQLIAELLILVGIICLPTIFDLFTSWFKLYSGDSGGVGFVFSGFAYLTEISLILYLIWSGGESFSQFGFRKPLPSDLLWAIPLILIPFGLGLLINHFTRYPTRISNAPPWAMHSTVAMYSRFALFPIIPRFFYLLFNLISALLLRELFFRSYLIVRLEQIGWKTGWAVILSTILYAFGPIVFDPVALSVLAVMGLLFSLYFAKFRRIWPLVIAHFVLNLIPLIDLYHWTKAIA